jgi:DNA-binding transcriptional ArsR family regulator
MSIDSSIPDYELDDLRILSSQQEIRAMAHDLRDQLLDLLAERAATVAELAVAVERPKSTVAHHLNVLLDAGLVRVVRTRKVRAIEERFYGRTARIFYVGPVLPTGIEPERDFANLLATAAAESEPAHRDDRLRAIVRHARIPRERAAEFWDRVFDLVREFSQLPRGGDTVYGFAAGLYPTEYPSLPDPDGVEDEPTARDVAARDVTARDATAPAPGHPQP